MELGYASMNTPSDPSPDQLAVALVERGFTQLWIGEHSHIPVSRRTPYPAGGPMPEAYKQMMDPFLSLLAAALAAPTLRVGTGVVLPLEHDLFQLAKQVATIDRLTGGRFDVGVGCGWNVEELADHRPDIPWSMRYRALEESVAALRSLWTREEAEHHGRWFDFGPVWLEPKPLQSPHPPVVCGMAGPVGTDHTIRWGDVWMPTDLALGRVERRVTRFRERVEEAGRAPVPIVMVAWGDPTLDTLLAYRELGIEQVVVGPGRQAWDDPSTVMAFLDRYAGMVDALA